MIIMTLISTSRFKTQVLSFFSPVFMYVSVRDLSGKGCLCDAKN